MSAPDNSETSGSWTPRCNTPEVDRMRPVELREELKRRKLKTSGNKDDLIARLKTAMTLDADREESSEEERLNETVLGNAAGNINRADGAIADGQVGPSATRRQQGRSGYNLRPAYVRVWCEKCDRSNDCINSWSPPSQIPCRPPHEFSRRAGISIKDSLVLTKKKCHLLGVQGTIGSAGEVDTVMVGQACSLSRHFSRERHLVGTVPECRAVNAVARLTRESLPSIIFRGVGRMALW
ncbi:hypothetical protein KM043_014467 [Ampulex compressa]|nr:hypothetical protein KM043_014467 [Ampulex compressa]